MWQGGLPGDCHQHMRILGLERHPYGRAVLNVHDCSDQHRPPNTCPPSPKHLLHRSSVHIFSEDDIVFAYQAFSVQLFLDDVTASLFKNLLSWEQKKQ